MQSLKLCSRTSINQTLIIQISRLAGVFSQSQCCDEYLLVMIEILSLVLFKTTAFLKCNMQVGLFCFQRAIAAFAHVVTNENIE